MRLRLEVKQFSSRVHALNHHTPLRGEKKKEKENTSKLRLWSQNRVCIMALPFITKLSSGFIKSQAVGFCEEGDSFLEGLR